MLTFFTNLEVTNGNREDARETLNYMEGFQQSARGLLNLWSELLHPHLENVTFIQPPPFSPISSATANEEKYTKTKSN